MAPQSGEDIYATLLLNDLYLPGALVVAHSLRDAGTSKKLAVLVTLDTVSAEVITQLKAVYDFVIPVPRIKNDRPANLYLMNRADLHSAFTKINLWKQTQFRKIVYIDADVVAYRAPDELFDLPHPFAASPDIGWPDLFNTGVMVLSPNVGDYYALIAMAERGISFDGADQGLLNMHFRNSYHRLPFTYNVTPSAHYQYIPAYRHFQSSINMVHFIGVDKPWFQGRHTSTGSSPFDEMVGRWWAVYDRHYRQETSTPNTASSVPEIVQYFVKGEWQPRSVHPPAGTSSSQQQAATHEQVSEPHHGASPPHHHHQPAHQFEHESQHQSSPPKLPPMEPSWDAQRQPPPAGSKPEAVNFPRTQYEMSSDPSPFVAPERYPSPPRGMWYEVPKEPPAATKKPPVIFPWETKRPKATRVFAGEPLDVGQPGFGGQTGAAGDGQAPDGSSDSSGGAEHRSEPITPATPTIRITPSDPWGSFSMTNAWDEVPQIERYVDKYQKHRRTRSQGGSAASLKLGNIALDRETTEALEQGFQRRGSRVTDFPSEVERPSLPVTPAPVRRPRFWGGGAPGILGDDDDDDDGDEQRLPVAEGVPGQADWDPVAQLQKLAKQQSDLLLQKLGGRQESDLPTRPLPFGSEDSKSPTYVAPSGPVLVSPKPVKPGQSASPILSGSEETTPRAVLGKSTVPEPSYAGPGASFEKDDQDYPGPITPAPPTEEERDVLET